MAEIIRSGDDISGYVLRELAMRDDVPIARREEIANAVSRQCSGNVSIWRVALKAEMRAAYPDQPNRIRRAAA